MTALAAHRIGSIRYLIADITTALFGPNHPGATENWLHDLRTAQAVSRPTDTATAIIPPIRRRQPVAAIAAEPHFAFVDEHLGPLHLGPLQPAHIHDALKGAQR